MNLELPTRKPLPSRNFAKFLCTTGKLSFPVRFRERRMSLRAIFLMYRKMGQGDLEVLTGKFAF